MAMTHPLIKSPFQTQSVTTNLPQNMTLSKQKVKYSQFDLKTPQKENNKTKKSKEDE